MMPHATTQGEVVKLKPKGGDGMEEADTLKRVSLSEVLWGRDDANVVRLTCVRVLRTKMRLALYASAMVSARKR